MENLSSFARYYLSEEEAEEEKKHSKLSRFDREKISGRQYRFFDDYVKQTYKQKLDIVLADIDGHHFLAYACTVDEIKTTIAYDECIASTGLCKYAVDNNITDSSTCPHWSMTSNRNIRHQDVEKEYLAMNKHVSEVESKSKDEDEFVNSLIMSQEERVTYLKSKTKYVNKK